VNSPADIVDAIRQPNFFNADLRFARFQTREPVLTEGKLRQANFDGANLTGAKLDLAFLYDASLRDTVLDNADLSDADLRHADLQRADLRNAVLLHSKFDDANLTDAKLQGAIVHRSDWIEYWLSKSPPARGLQKSAWRIVATDDPARFRIESTK
jgi:uncharacterized protein YjbI with pentapeptide repeats